MTFTTTPLTNERVLVEGQDIRGVQGQQILDASQWLELGARKAVSQAQDAFDAAVEEFFKPLTEAAEKASNAVKRPTDSIDYVVLEEAEEGKPAKPGVLVKLHAHSVILRILESGNTDRLRWVGDELVVTEQVAAQSTPSAPATAVEQGDPFAAGPAEGTQA